MDKKDLKLSRVPTFGPIALVVSGMIIWSLAIAVPVSLSVMFLDWQDTFQVSRARTAAVQSTCVGLLFGGGIVAGYSQDRFGARTTSLMGVVMVSVGMLASFFAVSIEYLVVSTGILGGIGFSLIQLPCIPCAVAYVRQRRRSLVITAFSVTCGVTTTVLPLLMRLLVNHYGWRGAYLLICGLTMNNAALLLIMTSTIPDVASQHQSHLLDQGNKHLKTSSDQLNITTHIRDSLNLDSLKDETESSMTQDIAYYEGRENIEIVYTLSVRDDCISYSQESLQLKRNKPGPNNCDLECVSVTSNSVPSKWRFLLDPIAIIYNLDIAFGLGTCFSFLTMQMDFARTTLRDESGSEGLDFLMVIIVSSILGRLISGPLNLIPRFHSVLVMSMSSIVSGACMIALGRVRNYSSAIGGLAVMGVALGLTLSIYPKTLLDLKSVNLRSYPLALGLTSTVEGVVELVAPILIGFIVDRTESYFIPLTVIGSMSIAVSFLFILAWAVNQRKRTAASDLTLP